jgi:hypothetical protein
MLAAVFAARYVTKLKVSQYTRATVIVLIAAKRPGRVSYHSWGSRAMRCASAVKLDDSYPKPRAVPTPCGIRVPFVAVSYSAGKLAKPRFSRSTPAPWTTRHPSNQRSRSLPATACWPRRQKPLGHAMWRSLILLVLLLIAACQHRHPEFMSRVREDCVAGDQWACDLLDSLAKAGRNSRRLDI